ncbi:class I SAM-dependent methyltransferase [soil metagenome]
MFKTRSSRLERIDTGDYTPEEYERFLQEIAFINRVIGDNRALKRTLLKEIERENLKTFSVLDVGAGSGELLRAIAEFARKQKRKAHLSGLELNAVSAAAILRDSKNYEEISAVRGDALSLPFADNSFDYAICSLFTHHFTDKNVVHILSEMNRVSRRNIYIIDLHRHCAAYVLYKVFCTAFNISPLVSEDGSLSILRSFKIEELKKLGAKAHLENFTVKRHFPFRLVLESKKIA